MRVPSPICRPFGWRVVGAPTVYYGALGWGGAGGKITISGGNITANGGWNGAGIGSGWDGKYNEIAISGGNISCATRWAACIGSGWNGERLAINITGGTFDLSSEKGAGHRLD